MNDEPTEGGRPGRPEVDREPREARDEQQRSRAGRAPKRQERDAEPDQRPAGNEIREPATQIRPRVPLLLREHPHRGAGAGKRDEPRAAH